MITAQIMKSHFRMVIRSKDSSFVVRCGFIELLSALWYDSSSGENNEGGYSENAFRFRAVHVEWLCI